MKQQHKQNGFTLVELMLAMAFLTFVLLFIVTAMVQYMGTYNKGLVYKEINQAGRTIFEDITRSLRTSSANVRQMDEGRLCVGGQTYVWNTPLGADQSTDNRYQSGVKIEGIIRVPDAAGQFCSSLDQIPRNGETVIANPGVVIQSFTGESGDNGGLYSLALVMSTGGDNSPVDNFGNIECEPGNKGQFCAVASFETNIASRR